MTERMLPLINKSYMIMVFRSRQHAINFADVLKEQGIKAMLVPTPKELSLGCGFSVKFDTGYYEEVMKIKEKVKPETNGTYRVITKNNRTQYEKV